MTHWKEQKILPYDTLQLFSLVADIEKYPEFLPWVTAARILEKNESEIKGELVVRFGAFHGKYISRIFLEMPPDKISPGKISVQLLEGPFRYLSNNWMFEPVASDSTRIHFDIDFAFNSGILEKMAELFFAKAARKMVSAFEKRAKELYG